MTQRQIQRRVVETHIQGDLFDPPTDYEDGQHFPVNKVIALPDTGDPKKSPASPMSPVSPVPGGYAVSPHSTLPRQRGVPVIVSPTVLVSPNRVNGPHIIRRTSGSSAGMVPVGYGTVRYGPPPVRYGTAGRRRKQIIGDSVFFVQPKEHLVVKSRSRHRSGSSSTTVSRDTSRYDDVISVSSGISEFSSPDKSTWRKYKKKPDKSGDRPGSKYWVTVDNDMQDSVFLEQGIYSTPERADRDSLYSETSQVVQGRPRYSGGGALEYSQQQAVVIRGATTSGSRSSRPSTVSTSSGRSRARSTGGVPDPDYFYTTTSPYYTLPRNSARLLVPVQRTGEIRRVMDYPDTSLPRGMTIYRPSSEVALYPGTGYHEPVRYDTYTSPTTLVRSKAMSTSMPHLHKAGLSEHKMSKADKKTLKKLQKEEKQREKEEKKRQKEALKRMKKRGGGEPIYDVPVQRVPVHHSTVPRNYHMRAGETVQVAGGSVYRVAGRDPATRPPLAVPPPPPSRSELMKIDTVSPLNQLQPRDFHASAPDLLRVEQVYGTSKAVPRKQHPAQQQHNTHVDVSDGPRTVVLQKGRDGFGFVLRGAKSKHVPVSSLDFHPTSEYPALQYLDSVDQGSMAEKAGLKSGDFILEINGQNVVQASHERVVELIKASGDTLQLRVVTVRPAEKNNWFVHQDGCMTLPSRGKARAPQPPKRDPNTALSYSKARSKSFAEGLAEIEKLDQTLAQYDSTSRSKSASMTGLDKMGGVDTDPKVASIRARHAAKRVSCIHLDGEYVDVPGNEGHRRTTPPVPPKKYASPSELRIQRYHKKYQQGGTLEKARSTPNLIDGESGKEVIYATPTLNAGNGTLVKNGGNRQFSSNGYKTVLSIGSGDSDSSTSSDSITGVSKGSPRQNIYSVPHMAPRVTSLRAATHNTANVEHGVTTGTNVRREGAMPDRPKKPGPSPSGVVIPPPPRKPAPHPPVKSEVVKIIPSTIYANVSSDIQARKTQQAESPYESSFRPGANAKVTKEPDVVTASVEQAKLKKHQRNGSMGSLQYAQAMHAMSVEEKQRFGSFPRHGHGALEIARTSPNEEGPRSVSFADDKVFENAANFIEKHPNASLLVTANMKSAEKGRLSKELYEPAPDYDAESDEGETVLPAPLSLRSVQTTTSHRSSSSSASSASNRSDIPVHIHTQTTGTSAGHEEKTSVTIISVGNDSPKSQPARLHKTDEQSHYAISSNIPRRGSGDIDPPKNYSMESSDNNDRGGHAENSDDSASSGNSLRNQIRMAAMARDKRREEQYNDIVKDSVTAAPPAPPPPPPPGPPAAPPPPLISADGNAKMSRSSSQASVPGMPSALEIQSAAAERQTRIQNGGGEIVINRPNGEDTLRKKPMDHTQAAILAAVAKRRSVLEHTSEQSIVEQIESRLNKTKKLQSAKFYGSSSTMQKQADVKPVVTSTPPRTADKPNPATAEPVKTAPKPSPHSKQPTVIASRANRVENTTVTRKTDNQSVRTETAKPASSDFLAQAEKARQLYLQKKNTESSPKEVVKQTDNSIKSAQSAGVKVSSQLPLIKSQNNNNNKVLVIEKSSGKTNPSEEISNANKSISKDDNLSIRDKIKSFEKKLDLSAALKGKSAYEVRGVTMDHSYTEGDFAKANGHVSNNFTYKDELPPPMMAPPPAFSDSSEPPVSDDVVQIEIIPPPIHFGGEEQAGSLDHCNSAFGHDDSVSLHSSVSTLSTLSSEHGDISSDRVSYSGRQITTLDEVIAPPPPGFDDNHFNDNNYDDVHSNNFIPPPPEFQSGNNEKNTNMRLMNKPFISKTVDRWSCVDVLDWLESLSMLQYKSSFARQCIDGKRLVGLNRNDYIELGVTQVGHRMNIERSIKKLALQNTV